MPRGNIFANIENEFQFASKEEIIEIGKSNMVVLYNELKDTWEETTIFGVFVHAAHLGISGDGILSDDEKYAIKEILGMGWTGPIEALYEAFDKNISEEDYQTVESIVSLGNHIAMPFLRLILAFAYIDGSIEDVVAERLETIYGINLIGYFMQSGLESVPAPKVKVEVTDLELKIVKWMQIDDDVYQFDKILEAFPSYSKNEIENALNSLGEKDILLGKGKLMDGLYCLNDWIGNAAFNVIKDQINEIPVSNTAKPKVKELNVYNVLPLDCPMCSKHLPIWLHNSQPYFYNEKLLLDYRCQFCNSKIVMTISDIMISSLGLSTPIHKDSLDTEIDTGNAESPHKDIVNNTLTSQGSVKDTIMSDVFDSLSLHGRPMQVRELVDELGISSAKISSALKKLVNQGKVVITTDKGRSFYSTAY